VATSALGDLGERDGPATALTGSFAVAGCDKPAMSAMASEDLQKERGAACSGGGSTTDGDALRTTRRSFPGRRLRHLSQPSYDFNASVNGDAAGRRSGPRLLVVVVAACLRRLHHRHPPSYQADPPSSPCPQTVSSISTSARLLAAIPTAAAAAIEVDSGLRRPAAGPA
jgi:hypothetical protein